MKCDWSIVPYDRRLARQIVTAHGVYRERSGFLLSVRDADGVVGLGDVAPLPGFSPEALEDVRAQWHAIEGEVAGWIAPATREQLGDMSSSFERLTAGFPSLRFGLESALADLASRRAGISLGKWLCEDAADEAEVNALLVGDDPLTLAGQATSASAGGFRTFKMKVAIGSVRHDLERVAAVREAAPDANLRLDANEGWTESEAEEVFPLLREFDPEFVEQPLPVGQAALAHRLSTKFNLPLALDEEVNNSTDAMRLIADRICDGVVLKPMVLGGLLMSLSLAQTARQAGLKVIFTSTWESDVGLAATLHLACASGLVAAACGLSTAGMIAEGLVEPALRIKGGHLSTAGQIGLGLQLSCSGA
jgi:o-succinylbenzoate synthase